MKNKFLVVASAALVAMMSFVPTFAQEGTVVVTAGPKTVVGANISFAGITLDGTDYDDVAGTTGVWTATDFSGDGAGWALQISASQLTAGVGKDIDMANFLMTVPAITRSSEAGDPAIELDNLFVAAGDLTVLAQSVVIAQVLEGRGSYTFTPTFTLDVPATTLAGTYSSTIELTMAATP